MSENKEAQTIVHLSDVLRLLPYLIAWGLVSIIRELRLLGPWERAAVLSCFGKSSGCLKSHRRKCILKNGLRKWSRSGLSRLFGLPERPDPDQNNLFRDL